MAGSIGVAAKTPGMMLGIRTSEKKYLLSLRRALPIALTCHGSMKLSYGISHLFTLRFGRTVAPSN